jgi:hypothetical protein
MQRLNEDLTAWRGHCPETRKEIILAIVGVEMSQKGEGPR